MRGDPAVALLSVITGQVDMLPFDRRDVIKERICEGDSMLLQYLDSIRYKSCSTM